VTARCRKDETRNGHDSSFFLNEPFEKRPAMSSQCVAVCCSALQCAAVRYSALQRVAACCHVLHIGNLMIIQSSDLYSDDHFCVSIFRQRAVRSTHESYCICDIVINTEVMSSAR